MRHQSEIDDARRALIDADEAAGRSHALGALLHVLVSPLADPLDSSRGRTYLQIQAERTTPDALLAATRVMATRIARAVEDLPPDPVRDRLVTLLLCHSLADRARQEGARSRPDASRGHFVATLRAALEGLYLGASAP